MLSKASARTKIAAAGIAAVFAVAALGAGTAGAASKDDKLVGAGSSFVFPLVSQWIPALGQAYGISLTYAPVGSGAGIAQVSARTVDFGASDAPLTPDQLTACHGCVQIPWALGATAVMYNLHLNKQLHLTGKVLADIYLGKITQWNDPALKAINPGLDLPSTKITPVYRSDNSGTTYNLTDYLQNLSKDWRSKIGRGVNANWPAGQGAKGSSGVSGVVGRTEGAIGYADIAYALANHFAVAAVKNAGGKYVTPGIKQITAAASTLHSVPDGNEIHIVNPSAKNKDAYPIATFTYVILPTKTDKAPALRKMVFWALTKGQSFGTKLLFVPIPKVVLTASEKTLKQVQGAAT
jgi:phosphate transport system substrate-binding protein